ncbi:cell envelope integrity protein TolA [Pseudomonas umsongensis]|uniref:cell envelope integrity protein TolA n=1 Tax=Pseudomonas umsongensis TaxID=198618 RepID=UPI00124717B5|nr:cell envelope integrity protein TolA [Pseudomonas umsongensis]QFG31788.1 cell envelope integrity protein TolA [Pseudomonas umsongensis]
MDWIESLQKIAPWMGSLPLIHKSVLTAIVLGISLFTLLLIWLPVPSPKPEDGGTALSIVVNSSGAAVEAVKKLSSMLDSSTTREALERKVEKQALKRVIADLVRIEQSQAPLPWLLRKYVENDSPRNWNQVKDVISMNAPIVSELVEVLRSFDGDLIYKDIETYKQLSFMVHTRAGLYGELSQAESPKSDAEKKQLLKVADNFDTLISQMKIIQNKLSDYLKSE